MNNCCNYKQSWCLFLICTIFLSFRIASAQNANDIIISEIMADPTPAAGLPEKEYLELYNRTENDVNLLNFRLFYNNNSVILPNFILKAHSYALVTSKINTASFANIAKVIPVNSLSLLNSGALLILKNPKNKTIFSVNYSDKWYDSEKNQGYSLEMIDLKYPCVESGNWTSSLDVKHGSPGQENSVNASNPDFSPPSVTRFEIPSDTQLKLFFSEKIDSLSAINALAYSIDNSLTIRNISIESPNNIQVIINFKETFQTDKLYTLSMKNIADCSGNVLEKESISFGKVLPANLGDVVINEILFNPPSNVGDFVEIYNQSAHLISLKDWSLTNTENTTDKNSYKIITTTDFILKPRQFLVLCKDAKGIKDYYSHGSNEDFLEFASLPSFPDDSGSVILVDNQKKVFDYFHYTEKMHHPMLDNVEGVSLEKVDYRLPSSESNNWQSGAASYHFASPGLANSQAKLDITEAIFEIKPEIFSPDGDNQNETTTIQFKLNQNGYFANISVYDMNGNIITKIADNQLLANDDKIIWDGTNATKNLVSAGYYIILAELFNSQGDQIKFKGKVVVSSKY